MPARQWRDRPHRVSREGLKQTMAHLRRCRIEFSTARETNRRYQLFMYDPNGIKASS